MNIHEKIDVVYGSARVVRSECVGDLQVDIVSKFVLAHPKP